MRNISELKEIRKHLHQHPELSGAEHNTKEFLQNILREKCPSSQLIPLTETGFIAHFKGAKEKPTVLLRCELDALPIQEVNSFDYKSETENISHKCGHDGHMTILMAVAFALEEHPPAGDVYLLFQPAEETGEGAQEVLNSERFQQVPKADFAYALHNLPGTPLHSVHIKNNEITPSVISVDVHLSGKTSHAAEPQKGKNPDLLISELLQWIHEQNQPNPEEVDFQLITPIFVDMGTRDYGISAGHATMGLTLRTASNDAMEGVKVQLTEKLNTLTELFGIGSSVEWKYAFRSVQNAEVAAEYIRKSAQAEDLKLVERKHPFPWGEDFGAFTEHVPGALFGLGAGEDCPALHNPDYDFPEALIESGSKMFLQILSKTQA
ncbi:MAG: amidohydrolase [bacterium]|nr:amidohydrolase [bacterium]